MHLREQPPSGTASKVSGMKIGQADVAEQASNTREQRWRRPGLDCSWAIPDGYSPLLGRTLNCSRCSGLNWRLDQRYPDSNSIPAKYPVGFNSQYFTRP